MCNSHQPHHANKGKCVWKKTSVFLLAASLLSPLFACDECHFIEHCCAARWYDYDLWSRRHPWSLKEFKGSANDACRSGGFPVNPSSPLPALLFQSVEWKLRDAGQMTPAHPRHICLPLWSFPPNKGTRLNSEQLPSLKFISPGREQCSLCPCPQLDSTPRACQLIKKLGGTISLTRWRATELMVCLIFSGLHCD